MTLKLKFMSFNDIYEIYDKSELYISKGFEKFDTLPV